MHLGGEIVLLTAVSNVRILHFESKGFFYRFTHLHRDNVGPWGIGHCHPVWQVHAAVTVGPQERMRVGYGQCPGALPPLGGILWRLYKGNWEMRRGVRNRG